MRKAPGGQIASIAILWCLDIKRSMDNEVSIYFSKTVVLPFANKSGVGKTFNMNTM